MSATAGPQRWVLETLRAAGCPDANHDAELLLADAHSGDDLRAAVMRRASREPLGYVRGRAPFRGLELTVDPRVFIPRPETELLVDAALVLPEGARVLEPCTGSGAVALALKNERPDLRVTGSDRSGDALAVARSNGDRLGIPVAFAQADGISAVPGGPWDAVVANPPYVAEAEAGTGSLPEEIEKYEPPGAFWAGPDGLAVLRQFVAELDGVAFAAFEVGDDQAGAVSELLLEAGFASIDLLYAPSGQARIVSAAR